jgi:hypothetical protein
MAAMVISPDHSRALLNCQPANSRPKPLGHGGLDHHGAGDVDQGELGLALAYPDDRVHGLGQFVGDRGQQQRGHGRGQAVGAALVAMLRPCRPDRTAQTSPCSPAPGNPRLGRRLRASFGSRGLRLAACQPLSGASALGIASSVKLTSAAERLWAQARGTICLSLGACGSRRDPAAVSRKPNRHALSG